ncbi:MAG: alpha-(1-_3)-arabinofuranosyltransferase family protein [Nitrospirota bacterium]
MALPLVNRIWFILPFFLLAAGIYNLTSALYKGNGKEEASILATLFFIFNPLVRDQLVGGSVSILFARAIGVFLLVLIIRGLESSKKGRYLIGIAFISIFIATDMIVGIINLLIAASFIIYYLLTSYSERQKFADSCKFVIAAAFLILLVNLWWLFPIASKFLTTDIVTEHLGTDKGKDILYATKGSTNILYVIRMMYGYVTSSVHPVHAYERTFIGPLAALLIVLCAYSTLLFISFKEMNRYTRYFYLLAVVATLFATGMNTPFKVVFKILWNYIPLFNIFRNPMKFTYFSVIAYSYLIGFLWLILREKIIRHASNRILVYYSCFLSVILISGWPFLTGNLIGFIKPVEIPKYYDEARDWIQKTNNNQSILILPNNNWYVKYKWTPYDLQDIAIDYLFAPVVSNFPGRNKIVKGQLDGIAYEGLYGKDADYYNIVIEALRLGSVKYIMLHKDIDNDEDEVNNLYSRLNNIKLLKHERSFEGIDFYSIISPLPRIYAADRYYKVFMDYNLDTLYYLQKSGFFRTQKMPAIEFIKEKSPTNQQSAEIDLKKITDVVVGQQSIDSQMPPNIGFKKINPTRYLVDVKGAEGSFVLVFSDSFNKSWKAYIRQKAEDERLKAKGEEPLSALWSAWSDRGNRLEIKEHFMVNGFANGWIVQTGQEAKGEGQKAQNFEIVLEYKPQRLLEAGVLISAVTLLGCIGYLGYDLFRRRRNNGD